MGLISHLETLKSGGALEADQDPTVSSSVCILYCNATPLFRWYSSLNNKFLTIPFGMIFFRMATFILTEIKMAYCML